MTRPINWIVAGVVVIGALALTSMQADSMRSLQAAFLSVMGPILGVGSDFQRTVNAAAEPKKPTGDLRRDNEQLLEEVRTLRTTNALLRDLEVENNKLREALQYRERSVFKLIPARIISRDASAWWNTVKINRGFEDGIEPDHPVLTESGLIGKTTTVSKNISTVLLITDENCRVAAKVEGTREQGIVSGMRVQKGDAGELQLNFLTKGANLQAGQKIYSAGVGGVFPSGIPIGTVKSFRVRELDGQAIIEPAEDISRVEDVFVIVGVK